MRFEKSIAVSVLGSLGLLTSAGAAWADVVPLTSDSSLPGVLEANVTDAIGGSASLNNSVPGSLPVVISGSATSAVTNTSTKSTPVTTSYQTGLYTSPQANIATTISQLSASQLAALKTGGPTTGSATTTTTSASAPKSFTLTNAGSSMLSFDDIFYFHAETYKTALVGGTPGAGGTGVAFVTDQTGVAGTTTLATSSQKGTPTTTSSSSFSTPVQHTKTVGGQTEYYYTFNETVTTSVATPTTVYTGLNENTITNKNATSSAFSSVSFSLLKDAGVWSSAGPVNDDTTRTFTTSDFGSTPVYTTSAATADPSDGTIQLLSLGNNGTASLPTLYSIAHADEYAFEVKGVIAAYSTGSIYLYVSSVPELSTWIMMALGFVSLGCAGLRARREEFREEL